MKVSTFIPLIAACIGAAEAHTRVFSLWVNGVDQGKGEGKYLRQPPSNSPIKDVSSTDITCNVNGNKAVASSISVKAGDKIDIEWHHDNRGDDIIDLSHKGPITVYIADAASNGLGAVWTKIAEDGFSNGKWAVEKLVANGGRHSVTLPSALAAGDYLLRAEIIAHHESDTDFKKNPARGAQFYPSCSQIKVTSGGSAKPNQNFNFVGGYKSDGAGILFNLYNDDATKYVIPGPPVWNAASSGSNPAPVPSSTKTSTTQTPAQTQAPVQPPANGGAVTVTVTATVTATTTVNAGCSSSAPTGGASAAAAKYSQCGGKGFTGSTQCASGSSCKVLNPYYSQCL